MTVDTSPSRVVHRLGTNPPSDAAGASWVGRSALRAIEWYQRERAGVPSPCRFFPSCSEYAHEAISQHGSLRGGWLAVRRLARCRPFGRYGFDPVPERHTSNGSCCASHAEVDE